MAKDKVKLGKFAAQIAASGAEIKEQRASSLERTVKRAAEAKVRNLEDAIDTLDTKILDLTDLAPDTSYSLRPGGKEFNAEGWVNELNEAKLEIKLKRVELEVANEILVEWFS